MLYLLLQVCYSEVIAIGQVMAIGQLEMMYYKKSLL